MNRYLSGLCVAGLGLVGGGWLVVAAVAFGGDPHGAGRTAELANACAGTGLVIVSVITLCCWAVIWRRRMRLDGVLVPDFASVSRRQARRNRRALSRDVRQAARLARREEAAARAAAGRAANVWGAEEGQEELMTELRSLLAPLLTAVDAVEELPRVPAPGPSRGNDPALAGHRFAGDRFASGRFVGSGFAGGGFARERVVGDGEETW